MRLLVSCQDSGSLKEVVCNLGVNTSIQDAEQPLHLETNLAQNLSNCIDLFHVINDRTIILARNNGNVELVSCELLDKYTSEEIETARSEAEASKDSSKLLTNFQFTKFDVIDTISKLLDSKKLEPLFEKSKKRTKLTDGFVSLSPLPGQNSTFILATKSGYVHIIQIKKNSKLVKLQSHEIKAPLEFAQLYDGPVKGGKFVFAYGGEENLIKLVEMSSNFKKLEQIWEAKNVPNDRIDLRVPVWPMAVRFLKSNEEATLDKDKLNYQFVAITRWSHLGIYKTQHGRKPLHYIDLLPKREPLTGLSMIGQISDLQNLLSDNINEFSFVTMDTKKDVLKFNEKGRLIGKFGKGEIVGMSNYIQCVNDKYLIQGGADRYLRVFDLKSTKLLVKIYMGSKINYIKMVDDHVIDRAQLPKPVSKKSERKRQMMEETEQDVEELWSKLENRSKRIKK